MTAGHPATDALEHLQRAALELLGAARSGLDLVEDLVADPRAVSGLARELAHAARVLLNEPPAGRSAPDGPGDHPDAVADRGPGDREDGAPPDPLAGAEGGGDRYRPRVQRVPLT